MTGNKFNYEAFTVTIVSNKKKKKKFLFFLPFCFLFLFFLLISYFFYVSNNQKILINSIDNLSAKVVDAFSSQDVFPFFLSSNTEITNIDFHTQINPSFLTDYPQFSSFYQSFQNFSSHDRTIENVDVVQSLLSLKNIFPFFNFISDNSETLFFYKFLSHLFSSQNISSFMISNDDVVYLLELFTSSLKKSLKSSQFKSTEEVIYLSKGEKRVKQLSLSLSREDLSFLFHSIFGDMMNDASAIKIFNQFHFDIEDIAFDENILSCYQEIEFQTYIDSTTLENEMVSLLITKTNGETVSYVYHFNDHSILVFVHDQLVYKFIINTINSNFIISMLDGKDNRLGFFSFLKDTDGFQLQWSGTVSSLDFQCDISYYVLDDKNGVNFSFDFLDRSVQLLSIYGTVDLINSSSFSGS